MEQGAELGGEGRAGKAMNGMEKAGLEAGGQLEETGGTVPERAPWPETREDTGAGIGAGVIPVGLWKMPVCGRALQGLPGRGEARSPPASN